MKYYLIFVDKTGLNCEVYDDITVCNDMLTEVYTRFMQKENETGEPMVIVGTAAEYEKKVQIECTITA